MNTKTRLTKLEKEKKRSALPVVEEIVIIGTREDGTTYEISRTRVNEEVKHDNEK